MESEFRDLERENKELNGQLSAEKSSLYTQLNAQKQQLKSEHVSKSVLYF